MVPEFLFIAAAAVVCLATFAVLRQDKSAFASNLRERIEALQVHVKQRETLLEDCSRLQSRYLFLKQSCNELSQKENRLREDIDLLQPRAAEVENRLRTLSEEKVIVEARLRELEEDRRKWEDRIKELDRLDELVGDALKKRKEIDEQIEVARQEFEAISKQLSEVRQSEEILADLKQELEKVERLKATSEQELEKLQLEKVQAEAATQKAREELERLEKSKEMIEDVIKGIQGAITVDVTGSVGGENGKQLSKETFKPLFEPEFKPAEDLHSENPDNWLGKFSAELLDNGYDFPKRLIQAFHTSLKVQDVSCLTVMAGISGTGKSALPRLYADYMGLHFLLVPVEPRWDSPQDLFGFLNYMENRYESTPLGRALNQFNLRGGNSEYSMQDEVLLVLLDEMNLARVEYYFSEFLSRLEARRDLDWLNDSEAYRKVSMEIFAGDEQEGGNRINPIRLFAGPNVLFVGTMNEDESTQSLTDKVLDRSNAIHFGRPKALRARPKGVISASTEKVSYDAWKASIKDNLNNSATTKAVDEYLTKLNESFDRVGRPFGHRSFTATCSYIANYPEGLTDDISEMTALADQVAMRFLPKLRGLDLTENRQELDMIRRHIAALNDQDVMDAFNSAADPEKSYFQWRGINWGN